jgi:hypothetical protein
MCPKCGEGELPTNGLTDEENERRAECEHRIVELYRQDMKDAGRGHLLR